MADMSIGSLNKAIGLFDKYDPKIADEIRREEGIVDTYEDALGSYLVKISARGMDEYDSVEVTKLLHIIGDLERISDHSVNFVESIEEIRDKQIKFSEHADLEINVIRDAVEEILLLTKSALYESDTESVRMVEPLEQVIDYLHDQIKLRHTLRLQKSECSIELGFILSDLLTNFERVSDHCSNIAGCLIEISRHESLDIHNYMHDIRESDENFDKKYKEYMGKYVLPSSK